MACTLWWGPSLLSFHPRGPLSVPLRWLDHAVLCLVVLNLGKTPLSGVGSQGMYSEDTLTLESGVIRVGRGTCLVPLQPSAEGVVVQHRHQRPPHPTPATPIPRPLLRPGPSAETLPMAPDYLEPPYLPT